MGWKMSIVEQMKRNGMAGAGEALDIFSEGKPLSISRITKGAKSLMQQAEENANMRTTQNPRKSRKR